MVSNSKILTVSYGTFSCTLEGFDEPFNTMKSIAEYFRDLAADDRYFGAEPPTPDAEMLHRIAEREVQKRVEARVEESGVVLRQEGSALPSVTRTGATVVAGEALVDSPEPSVEEVDVEPAAEEPVAEERSIEPPKAEEPEVEIEEPTDTVEESVAAKLGRLRAVVDAQDDADEYVEDQDVAAFFGADDALEDETLDEDEPVEDDVADTPAEQDVIAQDDDEEELVDWEDPDVAALEAQADEEEDELDNMFDDASEEFVEEEEDEEDPVEMSDSDLDEAATSVDTVLDALNEEDDVAESKDYDDDEDVSAVLAQVEEQITGDLGGEFEDEDELDDDEADVLTLDTPLIEEEEAEPRPVGRVVRVKRLSSAEIEARNAEQSDEMADEADPSSLSDDDEADLHAELSAVENGDDLLADDLADKTAYEDEEDFGLEDDEDENDTLRSLIEQEVKTEARRERREQAFDNADAEQEEGTVDRILAETNDQMDSKEVSRRRKAIEHLKAAVLAKRADDDAGKGNVEDHEEDPYRKDLARAVSPKPERSKGREGSAASKRMAPLVLVSEQRIDEEAPKRAKPVAPAASVRPTRVVRKAPVDRDSLIRAASEQADADPSTVTEGQAAKAAGAKTPSRPVAPRRVDHTSPEPESDFAKFLSGADASDMTGIMEAAAAFLIHEKGLPQFTRPQAMGLVLGLEVNGGISREEGLRAFGRLLREERIVKVARGRYILADTQDEGDRKTA